MELIESRLGPQPGRPMNREEFRAVGEVVHKVIHEAGICEGRVDHFEPLKNRDQMKTVFDVATVAVLYVCLPFLWCSPIARHFVGFVWPFFMRFLEPVKQAEQEQEEASDDDDESIDDDEIDNDDAPSLHRCFETIRILGPGLRYYGFDVITSALFGYLPHIVNVLPIEAQQKIAFLIWLVVSTCLMPRRIFAHHKWFFGPLMIASIAVVMNAIILFSPGYCAEL